MHDDYFSNGTVRTRLQFLQPVMAEHLSQGEQIDDSYGEVVPTAVPEPTQAPTVEPTPGADRADAGSSRANTGSSRANSGTGRANSGAEAYSQSYSYAYPDTVFTIGHADSGTGGYTYTGNYRYTGDYINTGSVGSTSFRGSEGYY